MEKVWVITGYNGAEKLFETDIPFSLLSETEIETLLQRLVALNLNVQEVISGSLRRNAPGYAPHFETDRNRGGKFAVTTSGSGYHYTATVRLVG